MKVPMVVLAVPLYLGLFVGFWAVVTYFLNRSSGWARLARRFARSTPFQGALARRRTASMGWVRYRGVLAVGADSDGLYLALFKPFSLGARPLYIPFAAMGRVEHKKFLYHSFSEVEVEGVRIQLFGAPIPRLEASRTP